MHLLILARHPELYSHQRLLEAATERGHHVRICNTLRCHMILEGKNSALYYENAPLSPIDAVIPRLGPQATLYGTALIRQCALLGAYVLNSAEAILAARDKWHSLQLCALHNLPIPTSAMSYHPLDAIHHMERLKDFPVVVKLRQGAQGNGVMLADSVPSLKTMIGQFKYAHSQLMLQRFIHEAKGQDVRCFVIGDKVVAAMERQAKEGEFRSNVHKGGAASKVTLTEAEEALALKAAKVVGLNVAGVDLIRTEEGPMLLELNATPGFEALEKVTNINIASQIISYIETAITK